MPEIFETVLKMNLMAAAAAAVVLPVKLLLEKVGLPRGVLFWLWAVIAFRLVCPIAPQSGVSLMNVFQEEAPQTIVAENATAGLTVIGSTAAETDAAGLISHAGTALCGVWLSVAAILLFYGAAEYLRLRKKLRFAVRLNKDVYSAEVGSAFVFGIVRPKIYIPVELSEPGGQRDCIIAHERAHIARLDHITKLLAYVLISIHWFNPLNRLLFRLFTNDMEIACDERALRRIGEGGKKAYMDALLLAAVGRTKMSAVCRVCFAESATKRRFKAMLKFRRRSRWLGVIAAVLCMCLGLTLMTDAKVVSLPSNDVPQPMNADYLSEGEKAIVIEQDVIPRQDSTVVTLPTNGEPLPDAEILPADGTLPEPENLPHLSDKSEPIPEQIMSEQPIPEQPMPEHIISEQTMPEQTLPEQTTRAVRAELTKDTEYILKFDLSEGQAVGEIFHTDGGVSVSFSKAPREGVSLTVLKDGEVVFDEDSSGVSLDSISLPLKEEGNYSIVASSDDVEETSIYMKVK
ncbi:MAG: M56 family metallopeptidase [Oscillospiraceae bacterium]|nr:M56 family metallopeptidase [Oscillospiraceae bacterium]